MPTNRISIILSDDLAERLERVKETLDVSYVCEHSINAAVTTEESKLGILSKREAAIARLKVEAFNECDKWSRKGQRDGLELAPDLSFAELQQAMGLYELQHAAPDELTDLFDLLPEEHFLAAAINISKLPPYVTNSYLSGVLLGVMEFWNSIQDEVEGD